MSGTKQTKRIPQLEGLRFIMCCIIILSHFEFLSSSKIVGGGYTKYFHNATMAVDYFFMLSGFGIYLSPKRPEKSYKSKIEFAKNKIKKIYPAYIVSLVVMLPCTYIELRPYGSTINAGLKSLTLLAADASLFQSVTGMTFFSHSLNGVCWFLSCIFVCYTVMAFVIKKIDNIRSKQEAEVCFLISIIIVLLLSFVASKLEQMNLDCGKINDLWYGHPAIRWWYLLIGAILGTLYKKTDIELGTLTEVEITAVACVYFVLRNTLLEIMNQNFLRFFDLLLCSMVLFGFSKGTGFISQALSNNRMLWLSRTTMYLYLFHYPVRALVDNFFVKINAISTLGEVGFIFECFLIIVFTSFVVCLYMNICNLKSCFVASEGGQ